MASLFLSTSYLQSSLFYRIGIVSNGLFRGGRLGPTLCLAILVLRAFSSGDGLSLRMSLLKYLLSVLRCYF